ncbi:ATP-binding protein [Thioalkalivibrio sp. ALE16]|uniref:ATP-binding protein n=1 Tax=Thioalkalivibrio sp. ALE16 TaxID=1158172 RepID=UPI000362B061|nr:ATP-binding protein [Thioalkalivibrio sp. ALE16]
MAGRVPNIASDIADHDPPIRLLTEQGSSDGSGQVLLRSKLRAVSRRMGFSEAAREHMELACKEMVTNQVKYAGGAGLVQIWETTRPAPAVDLFAMDFGPGIPNLPAALEDGYTTSGTMGKGLGAIRRLAHESEFYTIPNGVAPEAPWHGTAIWARFHPQAPKAAAPFQAGQFLRAYQDGPYNGDCLDLDQAGSRLRWLHMDGLGHGAEAHDAVSGSCQASRLESDLQETLGDLSKRLRGGRGAVALAGEVDAAQVQARVCGVGDMNAYLICNGEKRNVTFSPGVLGHAHRSFDETEMAFPAHALLMTCSDGIRRTWTLGSFPSLWRLHPQLIALLLGQVLGRGNDDKSLLVIRSTPAKGGTHG